MSATDREEAAAPAMRPGRLRSLWDMLEIDAHAFVGITNILRSITGNARQFPERVNQAGLGNPVMAELMRRDAELLTKMRLPTTCSAFFTQLSTLATE